MMKIIQVICICLMLASGSCMENSSLPTPAQKPDEGKLISSFLNMSFSLEVPMEVPFIIREKLVVMHEVLWPSFTADLIKEAEGHGKRLVEAVQDFCGKNAENGSIRSIGKLPIQHTVLTEKEHNELFNAKLNQGKDGWELYYEKYPGWPGIITLSRPGFSVDGTIAVIYMGIQKG